MRTITLTANDGEMLTGKLPENWSEVPLQLYATLAATATQDLPEGVPAAHLFSHDEGCAALAALLGLPAGPLQTNKKLLLPICEAAPFLFVGPLPTEAVLVPIFTHLRVSYTHCGSLDDTTGGQLEALLDFLKEAQGNPLTCAPHLLALLYQPTGGAPLTRQSVATAAQAFATLPVSLGWPAVLNFLTRFAPMAILTQKYSAAQQQAEQALSAMGKAVASPTLGRRGCYSNMLRWLIRTWIRLVRKQLAISSPPSLSIGAPTK